MEVLRKKILSPLYGYIILLWISRTFPSFLLTSLEIKEKISLIFGTFPLDAIIFLFFLTDIDVLWFFFLYFKAQLLPHYLFFFFTFFCKYFYFLLILRSWILILMVRYSMVDQYTYQYTQRNWICLFLKNNREKNNIKIVYFKYFLFILVNQLFISFSNCFIFLLIMFCWPINV